MDGQESKTAVVCVGGGMRSAHSAGFLYGLGVHLKIERPHVVVGSSGGAGNVMYYAAGQYEVLRAVWTEELSSEKFISFLRFARIMDVDYLVDTVFKKLYPLDRATLRSSKTAYSIATKIAKTGKVRYGTEQDGVDEMELLRASKAIPVLYGKNVALPWGECNDGQFGSTTQDHVDHAIERGARRIVAVDDSHFTLFFLQGVIDAIGGKNIASTLSRNYGEKRELHVPDGVQVLHIEPRELPVFGITGNSGKELKATFEVGVRNALDRREELVGLFKGGGAREERREVTEAPPVRVSQAPKAGAAHLSAERVQPLQ